MARKVKGKILYFLDDSFDNPGVYELRILYPSEVEKVHAEIKRNMRLHPEIYTDGDWSG